MFGIFPPDFPHKNCAIDGVTADLPAPVNVTFHFACTPKCVNMS